MNTYEIMNYNQNNNKCLAHVYTKYQNKYSENKHLKCEQANSLTKRSCFSRAICSLADHVHPKTLLVQTSLLLANLLDQYAKMNHWKLHSTLPSPHNQHHQNHLALHQIDVPLYPFAASHQRGYGCVNYTTSLHTKKLSKLHTKKFVISEMFTYILFSNFSTQKHF